MEANNKKFRKGRKEKPLKVRCYICKETSYILSDDDGLPRLCFRCHRQQSSKILIPEYYNEMNTAFRVDFTYKADHLEDLS